MIHSKQRGFVICTEPRSGSNFLCQLLASTGRLGNPLEYFNTLGRRAFDDPAYPRDPEAQLRIVLERGATPNGVYGAKIFSSQFDRLVALRWAERLPNLEFIFLQRRDLLGQAISRVRAKQTGRFRSYAEGNGGTEYYDRGAIAVMLREAIVGNGRWAAWFAQAGIEPLVIYYEDLVRDPGDAIKGIAARLSVPEAVADFSAVDVKRQSDDTTEVWRRRFIEDSRQMDRLPHLSDAFGMDRLFMSLKHFARRIRSRLSR